MQTYQQAVDKVVNFWIEKSFNTSFNQNNGDDSENGAMAFMLMNMVSEQAQKTITPEKIASFKSNLTDSLLKIEEDRRSELWLDVDYNPCRMLYEAAKATGVDPGCFPCKTVTRIDKNVASAKYQYGGKWYEL